MELREILVMEDDVETIYFSNKLYYGKPEKNSRIISYAQIGF